MIPPEVEPILNALVTRYGATDGTLLFNSMAEGTGLKAPLLRAMFAGVEPHLADLELPTMNPMVAGLLESGLIEARLHSIRSRIRRLLVPVHLEL